METSTFGFVDYIICIILLAFSSAIGIYYRLTGGRQQTEKEYLHGDKTMSPFPVAFSLMASFMSAITLMGVTQENYMFGTQFVVINLAYIIGTPIAAYCFLPVFFRLQVTSAYEYLDRRFGRATRLLASLAFTLQMVLYMSVVLYAPAIALSAVTKLSHVPSMIIVGVVCTFYSTIGGMKAVLITDVVQSLLMFSAIFAVIICGIINMGDFSEIFRRIESGERLEFFEMDPDPTIRHTFWTQSIGGIFIFLSIYGVNQAQVQRLLSIGELKRSQLSLWMQWPILTMLSLSTSFAGLVIYAYYQGCDPVTSGRVGKLDQLLPTYVVDTMSSYPGLPGLFVSGIFSGSLSTVSSSINSLAAVTLEDYIKPIFKPTRPALTLKLLALMYGFLCLSLAFFVDLLGPGVLQVSLTIFGVVGGPLLGLFTLGMSSKTANQPGAIVGFLSSLTFLFWIAFGGPKPNPQPLPLTFSSTNCSTEQQFTTATPVNETIAEEEIFYLYRISYAWTALIGFLLCLLVGLLSSWIAKLICHSKVPDQLDKNLFFQLAQNNEDEQGTNSVELLNIKTVSSHSECLLRDKPC